jgi:ADP-ribose pyrophosphatase YjhB (NUDIX family)
MTTLDSVEKLALELPESQRAELALHMLHSLPPLFLDEDEGISEAVKRDLEMETNPSLGVTLEQMDQKISARRTR